jgi:hypothetical protein
MSDNSNRPLGIQGNGSDLEASVWERMVRNFTPRRLTTARRHFDLPTPCHVISCCGDKCGIPAASAETRLIFPSRQIGWSG